MKKFLLLIFVCLITTAALAANLSGTLTDNSGPASISWNGGPLTGALGYGGLVGLSPPCNSTICDIYNLTLSIPSNFYSSNPNFAVHVTLTETWWGHQPRAAPSARTPILGNSLRGATRFRLCLPRVSPPLTAEP